MSDFIISEDMLDLLREKVKGYMNEKRYVHTLGVEDACRRIGELLLPDEVNKLRAAALLHDITKTLSSDEQLKLCSEFGIEYGETGLSSPGLLHGHTASELIKRDFPEFADDKIVSAVKWHTTGRSGMTLFDGILDLADYIEDNRTYEGSSDLRSLFWDSVNNGESVYTAYLKTMVKALGITMSFLIKYDDPIDVNTVEARNYYLKLLSGEI
ncbi:MAG: HD domain-containing protein [Clostridia bacterium]|nr:HD domain-containing protein [Clostridia bacterium]